MSRYSKVSEYGPRNGHTLVVGIVARISGCGKQTEMSIDDQIDHIKEVVEDLYAGPVAYQIFATVAKGERLDRPELSEIETGLRSKQLDLLMMEDLGRLVRGAEACWLFGIAVDHGTRCISPNDNVDTADEQWEKAALAACSEHVAHNTQTSLRLKNKLMNRFRKEGYAYSSPIAGYIVTEDGKTYDAWRRDDDLNKIIREGAQKLWDTRNASAVADFFNASGMPVGPYCRRKKWDGAMVLRFYKNPLLSGRPGRGFKHTIKHHESGRRISVRRPGGPTLLNFPHLAHLDPVEQDDLIALLKAKNGRNARKKEEGTDPLLNVPRKRTRFPGQHAKCWYCGQEFRWGLNGAKRCLTCDGALNWTCWNAVCFEGALVAKRIVEAVTAELFNLDGFDAQYAELVELAVENGSRGLTSRWATVELNEAKLRREQANVKDAIAAYGPSALVKEKLDELAQLELANARERWQLEALRARRLVVPQSTVELRELLSEEFKGLAIDSPEFGDLLRKLVPEFHVYNVRLCDDGHLVPRARVKLDLGGSIADSEHVAGLNELLSRTLTIDLFDRPPQRERIREDAVRIATKHPEYTYKQIAKLLPADPTVPSGTAVGHALALDRQMKTLGLASPYITLLELPIHSSRLRRHKNPRYQFRPVEGYQPPEL